MKVGKSLKIFQKRLKYIVKIKTKYIINFSIHIIGRFYTFNDHEIKMLTHKGYLFYFYDSYDEFADITDASQRRRYETMLNDADLSDEMKAKIMEKMSGKSQYEELLDELSDNERRLAKRNDHFYKIKFKNIGGLVMPLIIEMTFEDGSTDVVRIPVEIWRFNRPEVSKVFKTEKKVVSFTLDPFRETADTFRDNNHWPPKNEPTLFDIYKYDSSSWYGGSNPMQRAKQSDSK